MAASAASSSSKRKRNYDIFLSFRGTDVRKNFLSHLYTALNQNGIFTYIDNKELRKGEQISPTLTKAIEESRVAIIVFSEHYASSPWCLEEVAKIMECKAKKDLIVLPVFYKVEPREVREPRDSYGRAMAKHESKFGKDSHKVKRWKKALFDASNLSGWHLNDEVEAKLIKRIVKDISRRLDRGPLHVAKHLVGIHPRVVELESMLKLESDDDVLMIGLWGPGGIGKTTLGKALYNAIFRQFEGSCFLEDVRKASKDPKDLVPLQKLLLSEILPGQRLAVSSVSRGINLMQDRLCRKKVLLVLDDVNDVEQLNALAGQREWFGEGSRIIITTRDKHLLTYHGIEEDHIYEVKPLEYCDALELLNRHAFPRNNKIIMRDLVDRALQYADGLPLALKVLGFLLCGRREREWESALKKLAKSPDKTINDVLKSTYDELEDYAKEIFLDIACFFKGQSREHIIKVLDSCNFETTFGLQVLVEKALIIEDKETLQMHNLFQLMAMDIVKQQCPHDPGRRSRLWLLDDVLNVLSMKMVSIAVEVIALDLPKPEEIYVGANAFTNMRRLRVLIMINVRNSFQGAIRLPNKIKWFEWPCIPDNIPEFISGPKKKDGLDLPKTIIRVVRGQFKDFVKLKFLNLSGCLSLVSMPNLNCTPNLEELNLRGCINLECADELVAYHGKLQWLDLSGCSKLRRFPEIPNKKKSLRKLHLGETSIEEPPASTRNMISLEDMGLYKGCDELVGQGWPVAHVRPVKKFDPYKDRIILPGGEMPKWLLPNKEGYISFVASKDLYKKFLRVAICVVLRAKEVDLFRLSVTGVVNGRKSGGDFVDFCDLPNSDHACLLLWEPKRLWRVDDFGANDLSHFHLILSLEHPHGRVTVKNCGFQLLCKPLENDLEVLLRDYELLDPALFYEVVNEDSRTSLEEEISSETGDLQDSRMSTEEDSSSESVHKGLNIADFCIEKYRYSQIPRRYRNVFPGGEMPKEFVLVEGGTISFMVSQELYDEFAGLVLCVVFGVEDGEKEISFDIVPHVNGQRRNVLSGTLGAFNSDHMWVQYVDQNVLWGVLGGAVDFLEFDESYLRFNLSLRVLGGTVKQLGYLLHCEQLDDDLKVELEDNPLVDPASLCDTGYTEFLCKFLQRRKEEIEAPSTDSETD